MDRDPHDAAAAMTSSGQPVGATLEDLVEDRELQEAGLRTCVASDFDLGVNFWCLVESRYQFRRGGVEHFYAPTLADPPESCSC